MRSYTDSVHPLDASVFPACTQASRHEPEQPRPSPGLSWFQRYWTENSFVRANAALVAIMALTASLGTAFGLLGCAVGTVLGSLLATRVLRSVWLP